jgi:hypothetical protein
MYQLVITNLKKYTNYSLRINCATKIGSGPWSSPAVYVQTLEDGNYFIEKIRGRKSRDFTLDVSEAPRRFARFHESPEKAREIPRKPRKGLRDPTKALERLEISPESPGKAREVPQKPRKGSRGPVKAFEVRGFPSRGYLDLGNTSFG